MIKMKEITKTYQMGDTEVKALNKVTFNMDKGEFVSIVGPSGSGKSTLMNILGCLDVPDDGDYFLDGIDINNSNDLELAHIRNKKIGFVFQNFNLLSKLNAVENVEVPLMYRGLSAKQSKEIAYNYLDKVGLKGREKHTPKELSGGQQQRVAIARALACEPQIILADEPTGALDQKTGLEIMGILNELNGRGQTIVLITHDPKIAKQVKRSVSIVDGQLIDETR
ncbi:ABC transporter ATP-binding protein [Ruminiclostridium cellobioparum]|uniref:ABC-type antimicrobial peptide transport system, ATPase component n=1 Tax=Ruminiclostridium cellobioparum subsp. termitidis CT1112 TaxID=1195236 RepID=S0FST2_RUMCE|nr:ABC transporter ATP-binding protein [Ruminiclostridium cellobioparum]EMS73376.1 ABC-type antimicrobial peptide transport system, ATPase component [Ruminiclostridium cellobioparum subsp. termitidis CT1112]